MAEVENQTQIQASEEHSALPAKRKPDVVECGEQFEDQKKQKVEEKPSEEKPEGEEPNEEKPIEEEPIIESPKEEEPIEGGEERVSPNGKEEEEEEVVVVDRKGKGKMIVEDEEEGEEEDGDSDSSGDGVYVTDEDTDLSDDPLAEVDLDNILPSRTRRRIVPPPGAYEVNDLEEEDDSEDSDA